MLRGKSLANGLPRAAAVTPAPSNCRPSQKCLAAKSPSRTVPEAASTTTILSRFFMAVDIVDVPLAGGSLAFAFLGFGFFGVVFADIAISWRWRVRLF